MIEWIRKHMAWLMWIIVGLVTVTFLFFGLSPSSTGGRAVARVGDTVIRADELNQAYRNMIDTYRPLMKDKMTEVFEKSLRRQALQDLIVNRLMIDEAERLGLKVSDEELQASIVQMPSFARNGKFDKRVYDAILDRVNMTPAQFEAKQREFLLRKKLENLIRDGVAVNDAELAAVYKQRNPKAKPADYEKNKDQFRQSYLAEQQRDALTAFIRNIEDRVPVTIEAAAQVS